MSAPHLKDIEVAPTQEYHLVNDQPLYQKRFQKVLKADSVFSRKQTIF